MNTNERDDIINGEKGIKQSFKDYLTTAKPLRGGDKPISDDQQEEYFNALCGRTNFDAFIKNHLFGYKSVYEITDIEKINNICLKIRNKEEDYSNSTRKSALKHYLNFLTFKIGNVMLPIDIKDCLKSNYNIILNGAPGTGKTFLARQIAAKMIGCKEEELKNKPQFGFVQFHPSYDYTDFVEGLRKKNQNGNIVFERKDGVFKQFCKKALEEECPFVFVIDEINRGEISKIFGELFFSMDPGYRGVDGSVNTQYQNMITEKKDPFINGFYVPENVYVIGTMNDIDRSVESMDFAFRRRFAFKKISAKDTQFAILKNLNSDLREVAISKMNALNEMISSSELGLSTDYHIGAAYFNKIKNYANNWEILWNNHLKGVLSEYFRGNPVAENNLKKLKDAYNS